MRLEHIYGIIAKEGFADIALQEIDNYIKDIQNGTEDFPRFNSVGRPVCDWQRKKRLTIW